MAGAGGLPPNKIILKSTTKISLNDRFSSLRKQGDPANTLTSIRQRMQEIRQASARNRRLAQQMENRPSVIAALKLKKKSLKQRLGQWQGSGIKARLSLGGRGTFRGNRNMGRGRVLSGRGGSTRRSIRGVVGMSRGGGRGFGRGVSPLVRQRLGTQTGFANRRGNRGGRQNVGRSRRGRGFVPRAGAQFVGRGGGSGNAPNWRPYTQFRGNQQGGRGNFRGGRRRQQRGGRGGRRGAGSTRGHPAGQVPAPSKQELDRQLEDYMKKTKSFLDAELDAYMAEAATE